MIEKIVTFEVVFFVWVLVITLAGATISKLLTNNNVGAIRAQLRICTPIIRRDSEKKVILRLDDVQAYAYQEPTHQIITDTLSQGMPMVLGVIPKRLSDDKSIISFIKWNSCNLEIALHGWDHIYYSKGTLVFAEFEELNMNQANNRMNLGLKVLDDVFALKPKTFIPPSNLVSEGTRSALQYAGIPIVSAEGEGNGGKYDLTTSTEGLQSKQTTVNDIITACENRMSYGRVCVIVIHPQDFITLEGKFSKQAYAEYLSLLTVIDKNGWEVTTFENLLNE